MYALVVISEIGRGVLKMKKAKGNGTGSTTQPPKKGKSATWDSRQEATVREAILLLGDPLEAVIKLGAVGRPPIDVAIVLMGGVIATADALEVGRGVFDRMRDRPVADWKHSHLKRIEELTGIPHTVLPLSAEEAAKLPLPAPKAAAQDEVNADGDT
jgi:hypothetical protein